MRILSIGKTLQHDKLDIVSIEESSLHTLPDMEAFTYIIISGGDGTIRRVIKQLHHMAYSARFILNPIGSFSAGNMGDLQHIFLSETLRFGLLKNNMGKYLLALLFLLPLHLIMTPFMLMSSNRFFIFTPASFIKKFGSFYGEVKEMTIELEDTYNHIELDGDIVTITDNLLHIKPAGHILIVTV